jgi:hypothetical protein
MADINSTMDSGQMEAKVFYRCDDGYKNVPAKSKTHRGALAKYMAKYILHLIKYLTLFLFKIRERYLTYQF